MAHDTRCIGYSHLFPARYQVVAGIAVSVSTAQEILYLALTAACIAFGLALYQPFRVHAQSTEPTAAQSAIIVSPTFQEVTLEATMSGRQATVIISNQTDQPQTFELFAVNITQFDSSGAIVLSDKPLTGANEPYSSDIELPEPTVVLAPRQQRAVPFTIKNSLTLSPGGHYISLIIRSKPQEQTDAVAQSVLPAISSFVLVRKLGGEQYNLSLSDLTFPGERIWWKLPVVAAAQFENQGNIHTVPRGQLTITDIFGRTVVEGTINESSQFVFPRSVRSISVQLRQIRRSWPIMLYTISASGSSDPGGVAFSQTNFSFYISSVSIIVLIGTAVVIAAVLVIRKVLRRTKRTA